MHKKIDKKRIIAGVLIGSIILTGCTSQDVSVNKEVSTSSSVKVEQNNTSSKFGETDLLTILNNAKEIEVKEKLVSIGAGYDIYVDNVKVGEIKGKYVNLTGDVFELKDLNGNVVKSEKQIKRWNLKLDRMAEVYDKNKNITGYIGEEKIKDMFSLGYKFHFYNKNKNEIGYTDQKILSFTDTFKVYDMNNNLDYVIEGELVSLTSSYDIEVNDTSDIKAEDVVFYTAIQNEITRSNKKKSKSRTKKVSNIINNTVAMGTMNNSYSTNYNKSNAYTSKNNTTSSSDKNTNLSLMKASNNTKNNSSTKNYSTSSSSPTKKSYGSATSSLTKKSSISKNRVSSKKRR